MITHEELEAGVDVVGCGGCGEWVRVGYEVVEGDEGGEGGGDDGEGGDDGDADVEARGRDVEAREMDIEGRTLTGDRDVKQHRDVNEDGMLAEKAKTAIER